jgi:putative transposase
MTNEKRKLDGEQVRKIFEAVLPDSELMGIVNKAHFEERSRKRDAVALLRAMVIAAATGYGGRQRDVARLYFDNGAPEVCRGGFYAWFGTELEEAMYQVSQRATAYAKTLPLDLPPLLSQYARDFHIVDSTVIKLPQELFAEYPGAGSYAALKVHKRLSVGLGTLVDYHLSCARDHDAPHLVLDESWRGLGLLCDLGYASLKLLRDSEQLEMVYVIRLKEDWKPRVQELHQGEVESTFFSGTGLKVLLEEKTLRLDGHGIDATVTLGTGRRTVWCRLVGVAAPDGTYRFYLTNLPRQVTPDQIAQIYRVRWEIESDNKLDKSCSHLDRICARTGTAARALVHASMTSSMLASLIVHLHRLSVGSAPAAGIERCVPPLHPQSVARAMGSTALRIATAMDLQGEQAASEWQKIANFLYHLGHDPNWRRRPSVLDQMRGWRISPGRPKHARIASPSRVCAN